MEGLALILGGPDLKPQSSFNDPTAVESAFSSCAGRRDNRLSFMAETTDRVSFVPKPVGPRPTDMAELGRQILSTSISTVQGCYPLTVNNGQSRATGEAMSASSTVFTTDVTDL